MLRDATLELADDRRLTWSEFGDPEGHPVVYCHGMPGSRHEPAVLDTAAATHGIRLIAPDRPGYGGSARRPGRPLGEETEDVRALADHLRIEQFDALGYSGGGPHALACAAWLPDRVRRIGLISSLAPFERVSTEAMFEGYRRLWAAAQSDLSLFETALREAIEQAGNPYQLLLSGASEPDRKILCEPTVADAYARALETAMRQGVDGMLEDAQALTGSWPFDPGDVACPCHVWHGDRDGNAPVEMGQWLAREIRGAVISVWEGAGHFEAFRRADEVLEPHAS